MSLIEWGLVIGITVINFLLTMLTWNCWQACREAFAASRLPYPRVHAPASLAMPPGEFRRMVDRDSQRPSTDPYPEVCEERP